MHGVEGGGGMNTLATDLSSYRRPHLVHCQNGRAVSASCRDMIGDSCGWVHWSSLARCLELGAAKADLKENFHIRLAGFADSGFKNSVRGG